AYFTATGTSSASAAIGSLSAPSGISTQQNGNDVSISWNAATLSSGGAADGYRVKRSDGTTVCGSPTLVTALTCTDASVPGGTYTYTVTAVYRSFTKAGTSGSVALLTAPTVGSKPSNPSASVAPSFTFSGGGG